MKKIISLILALSCACSAFSQDTSPNMLKQKKFFNNPKLFEAPSIFADRAANAALVKDYEANPKNYADSQLIPVVICYISQGNYEKSKELLSKYLKVEPKSTRALKMMGTINFVGMKKDDEKGNEQKLAEAVKYFKRAAEEGDVSAVKNIASAYLMMGKTDKISEVLKELEVLAKDDLEALTMVLVYALRDSSKHDDALIKDVLSKGDSRKLLMSATRDGLMTILRIYAAKQSIWPENALVVPARAAAQAEAWPLAMEAYKKALKHNPKDTLALRGMSLVQYRTGGIPDAVDYIKQAIAAGDKSAASDGIEIFLLTGDKNVWNEFKDILPSIRISQVVRVGMIQYSQVRDEPDVFFAACTGDGSETVFAERRLDKIVWDGLKKFASDKRAEGVKAAWMKAGGSEASVKKIEAQIEAAKNPKKPQTPKPQTQSDDLGSALDKALNKKK